MTFFIPDTALRYGFRVNTGGAHVSMTMMLRDVRLLFAATTIETDYEEIRCLVTEENVLLKSTLSNSQQVLRRLRELYSLHRDVCLYRVLRTLWYTSEADQPLLALLCALSRDPLLRATASVVLDAAPDAPVLPHHLAATIEAAYPERYSDKIKAGTGRHAISTWAQSGHLTGDSPKTRARAKPGPASVAYALLLGHLCGTRGPLLFETEWARVLDASPSSLDSLAFAASQRGWLDYRKIGTVVEIGFSQLLQA